MDPEICTSAVGFGVSGSTEWLYSDDSGEARRAFGIISLYHYINQGIVVPDLQELAESDGWILSFEFLQRVEILTSHCTALYCTEGTKSPIWTG